MEVSSPAELIAKFAVLAEANMGKCVELSEVKATPSHPDIYRAKILNADVLDDMYWTGQRPSVYDTTRYDKLLIRRNITYSQRAEL